MYRSLGKLLPKLKKKIRNEYNFLSLKSFDELNVITVKDQTEKLYERLLEFNKREYIKLIKGAKEYALELMNTKKDVDIDEEDFLEYILTSYNNVTGYLYKREANRKRLRLAEEILTAKEFLSRKRFEDSLRRSANLWFTQSLQYGIEVEDKTCLEVFKKLGVKKVKWITEKDGKVCVECKNLNGKTFDIDKVPSKVHYNCRCYVVPYEL